MDSPTRKAGATPVDLATFLQLHGSSLPRTVKLVDGFCGTNDGDTLEADQILVFYKVEMQKMIIALDQFNQELCVPRNSTNKVQLLPFEYHIEHSTVQELLTDHQTPYFRVLEGIPSLQISSETTLKLLSNRPIHDFLKCEVVDIYDAREVQLPLQLTGRFQPLFDAREYYLEEVLAQYQLPINIRFVPQSQANDDSCARPLSSLGNLHLVRETEVEMVFAASLGDHLLLNLFPRTLDINVSCGFKITPESSKKITECRKTLVTSEKTLKRLDRIANNSFYFTACPIRRFNFESLKPPSISIPKPKDRVVQAELLTKATPEVVTKRDHVQLASKSGRSLQDVLAANQENCEVEEIDNNSWSSDVFPPVSKATEKDSDAVPALPPKLRSSVRSPSTTANGAATQASTQSPCRPVPKPRTLKRLTVTKEEHQENVKACVGPLVTQTQSQRANDLELSDKSESVPQSSACTDDDGDVDETFPELPPKPLFLTQRRIENEEEIYVSSSKEESPPPLPLRDFDDDCLAYSAVDITDWRAVEDRAWYTEVKDDGRVFKQYHFRNLDLSRICPPDESEGYLDMEGPGVDGKQHDQYIDPDESGIHEDLESPRLGEADREREGEAATNFERGESSEEDMPYEEIEGQETPRREHQSEENEVKLKKTKVENPSKNSRSKQTQRSGNTSPQSPHHAAAAIRQNDMIISSRQEEDFMDFKEIEQFFKFTKQLSEANVKIADLEKQVSESATKQPPASTGSTSGHVGNSKEVCKDSWDENRNRLDSYGTLCKHSQTSTQVGTRPDGCEKKMEEKKPTTLAPDYIGQEKSRFYQELSLTTVQERDEMKKSVSDSDDDYEDYVECVYDREFANQEKLCDDESASYVNVENWQGKTGTDSEDDDDGINPIYYNTVEIVTQKAERASQCYLQLDNPNDDEENVYVNVDTQKSDPDSDLINDISKPPPLPPKQRSSSLRDAQ